MIFLICFLIYILLIAINIVLIRQIIKEENFSDIKDFTIAIFSSICPIINFFTIFIFISNLNTIKELENMTTKELNNKLAKMFKIKKK